MALPDVKADQEPSIEEILESIRQIISEDGAAAEKTAAAVPSADKGVPLSLSPGAASASVSPDKAVPLSLSPEPAAAPDSAASLDLSVAQGAAGAAPSSLDLSVTQQEPEANFDVLDLTEMVKVTPDIPPQPQPPSQPAMAIEMMDKPMTTDKRATDSPDTLMSSQTAEAATEALSKLLAGNLAVEKEDVAQTGKVTLEDITRELMKPIIKTWLDQNLPGIIEKVVQREVEKLSRRAMDR